MEEVRQQREGTEGEGQCPPHLHVCGYVFTFRSLSLPHGRTRNDLYLVYISSTNIKLKP